MRLPTISGSAFCAGVVFVQLTALAAPQAARATPQFARQHDLRCTACHVVPPKLNKAGLAFQASGYRSTGGAEGAAQPDASTIPLAAWITGRFEDKGSGAVSDLLLPKVELISGGTIGERWSYFAEWRVVSLSLNSDGSQRDRGGRFEDLFLEWSSEGGHTVKVGQYRSLNQVDVSLRLSASEPLLFGNGLFTGGDPDPRIASLSRFSPSSRSPSVGYSWRSLRGDGPADGLFHYVTVPFTGELSIPLSEEASENASFELTGPAKGVYLETFYRRGHRSVGAHAFYSDESWLLTALGTYDWKNVFVTAGLGVDDQDIGDSRTRASLDAQYLFRARRDLRAAAGLRIEDVTDDDRRATYVPYLAASLPNSKHTLLLQLQYKVQEGSDSFVADLSLLF